METAKATSWIFRISRPISNSNQTMTRLIRKCRLILTFYKSFLLASLVVNACCIYFFLKYGYGIFNVLFWFKIITLSLIFYYINDYKKKEFYYYQNLGISKQKLWVACLMFDFMLFLFLLFQSDKYL